MLATCPTWAFPPLGTQRHLLQMWELPREVSSMGHQAGPPLCPALQAPVWVQLAKLSMMTGEEGLVLRLGTPPGNLLRHFRRRKDATFWAYRVTNSNFVPLVDGGSLCWGAEVDLSQSQSPAPVRYRTTLKAATRSLGVRTGSFKYLEISELKSHKRE